MAFIYWLMTPVPGPGGTIMMGVSMLYGCLGLFLLLSGVLCELIYKTGDNKVEDLSKLTIKI